MTKEEIKNTPELVDFMLDESVIADSREKLRKRLEKVCNLAIKALEQESCEDAISRQAVLDKKELVELEDGQSFYCINPEDVETLPSVIPQQKTGYWVSIDDVMSVFDDFMCGEVDEDGMDTFLEMLKDKAESEEI